MDISIRALTADMRDDYFDFFDNRAFSDDSPFYPCYCNAFNLSREQITKGLAGQAEAYGGGREGWKKALRESAWQMVSDGLIRGYLAYDGGLAVGWCNANDRLSYYRVGEFNTGAIPEDLPAADCPKKGLIKSIVCFEIAPEYRRRGIAGKLLERVCRDAGEEGYSFVEAYPSVQGEDVSLAFTGPLLLYEKAGFTEYARRGTTIVMRKAVR